MKFEWRQYSLEELKQIFKDPRKRKEFRRSFIEEAPTDSVFLYNLADAVEVEGRFDSESGKRERSIGLHGDRLKEKRSRAVD